MLLSHRSGQTLLEMIIAIGVIMVSTLATTGLIIITISAGRVSQNKVEAANLAREGIEVVRSIRDTNYLRRDQNVLECNFNNSGTNSPVEWDDSSTVDGYYCPLGDTCSNCTTHSTPPTRYYVATLTPIPPLLTVCGSCSGVPGDFFQTLTSIDEQSMSIGGVLNSKIFVQQSACGAGCTKTKYSRVIAITKMTENSGVGNIDYLDVTSTVKWSDRTGLKSLVAKERLYNWR